MTNSFFSYTLLGDEMKIDFKKLLYHIFIPVFLGSLIGFITAPANNYMNLNQPVFAPPGIVFPIVWTILYILMGISSYLISQSDSNQKEEALVIYAIQLLVNLLWSIWFFLCKWYLFSFFWILLLIVLVVWMIIKFYQISKISSYLQIPYLLWLIFASILNLFVYLLNM